MKYGFIKTAAATPKIRIAECDYNANQIIKLVEQANAKGTSLLVFPELCVTGYTCSDLFMQSTLIESAEKAVSMIADKTKNFDIVFIIGAPVSVKQKLYDCGIVIYKGEILGVVPKVNIPNYNEFNEVRYFASGKKVFENIPFAGQSSVLVSCNQIFQCENLNDFTFGVEIGEDINVSYSPSLKLAENGANIICNLSSNCEIVNKSDYIKDVVKVQSGKLSCAYVCSDASFGESSTDMVYVGHTIISENGTILSQKSACQDVAYADIDLEKIVGERRKKNTFVSDSDDGEIFISQFFDMKLKNTTLSRKFSQSPFIPSDENELKNRCEQIISIQSNGLATRLEHTGIKNVVLGLSGGLDSTLALIVCVHAFDMLSIDRKNIHTATMPCFGTTKRTKSNAEKLAEAYNVSFEEISIKAAVRQHFADIGHDESVTNITYENSQARERTQVLMDLSNKYNALVVGTGDLSELALGWATYNGDHMSMYGVNASVPKTLIRHLVAYEANNSENSLKKVLLDVLDTPVSPELLPPDKDGKIAQKTEDVVGPYELHDFFLYYLVRFGFAPNKIYYIAKNTFSGKYDDVTIKKWLTIFVRRFFTQQFKRSCLPDGPKVGSVGLSPRGDWKMPSDACVNMWLKDLDNI